MISTTRSSLFSSMDEISFSTFIEMVINTERMHTQLQLLQLDNNFVLQNLKIEFTMKRIKYVR